MNAHIISIGDELLIGQVINTNASWIAQELNAIGIRVDSIVTIADQAHDIRVHIQDSLSCFGLIILTGGLGPTKDDITKAVLMDLFGGPMRLDLEVLHSNQERFAKLGLPLSDINQKQAEVPDSCQVLFNRQGTAPGMWFEDKGSIVVSLPGVPYEMQSIFEEELIPRLLQREQRAVVHHTLLTTGMSESFIAEKIEAWEDALPSHFKLAYLPQPGMVRLRLSGYGDDATKLQDECTRLITTLSALIPDLIFGHGNDSLEKHVLDLLRQKRWSVATAESCTGGYLAHRLTSIAGSSEVFRGAIVAYDNRVKEHLLGVDPAIIDAHGAVSEACVRAMALCGRARLDSDCCIAISGIAGPSGGSPDKPVGTVWIAVATPNGVSSACHHFNDQRERTIHRAAMAALNMLRIFLK